MGHIQNSKTPLAELMWADVLKHTRHPRRPFFYGVKTTGVYCRPDCPSRRPARKNVEFFPDNRTAEARGYRACMRCKPNGVANADRIPKACRFIQTATAEPSLAEMVAFVEMSPSHFHRIFKAQMGVSPKSYAQAHRMQEFCDAMDAGDGVITSAIYDAGFGSSSRFYEKAPRTLGMSARVRRNGGKGVKILFAIGECSLGSVLVASNDKGVCALLLGDGPEAVLDDLQSRFPQAELVGDDAQYQALIGLVVGFVDDPSRGLGLPLDIRGVAFQRRVWEALQSIPAGAQASYKDIAERIGAPNSARAVAQACAANNIAVAIPCHRVGRADGALSGYRWGVKRKLALLNKEGVV